MPQQAAFLLFVGFIGWLYIRDVKRRPSVSSATWLVVLWAVIVASRPVSEWFQSGASAMSPDGYLEGSPTDRVAFLGLIVAGFLVLLHRGVSFSDLIRKNWWLFVFYAYCAISVAWSDYPFVAFKRWFKDFGSVIMAFVLLTERDPVDAVKAVLVRCACLLVPLSVLFVRYYPNVGRAYFGYNQNDLMYVGVATHKNTLGALLLVSSIILVWDLITRRPSHTASVRTSRFDRAIVLVMTLYLLLIANSATALVCSVLGITLFLLTSLRVVQPKLRHVELYILGAGLTWFALDSMFHVTEFIVLSLGRDMKLTTRTDAWTFVLSQDVNPLIGAGFKSFWTGDRMRRVWELFPGILQAHNGYVDKYLEGGILGLGFLAAMLWAGFRKIKRGLVVGDDFARVRLTFWIVILFYNFSEAGFNAMSLLWFVSLVIVMEGPASAAIGNSIVTAPEPTIAFRAAAVPRRRPSVAARQPEVRPISMKSGAAKR